MINAEQMINAPNLGLKGKMDLILFCEMIGQGDSDSQLKRAFLPFELKTGERELFSYNTQVSTLELADNILGFNLQLVANAKVQAV